jgi:LysM repeat protein
MTRAVAVAIVLAYAASARAQPEDTITVRVHEKDTLELIAAELYGDRSEAVWLVTENKLAKGKQVHFGDRIKAPVSRTVVTAKGDTFETLAAAHLGDASRATYLAEANHMSIEDSLATGTELIIPLRVTHVAQATETLASIAQLYFGDAHQAALLQKYNGLDKTSLEKGEQVIVLGLGVKVKPSRLPGLDGEAKARREHQQKTNAAAAEALPRARAAWLQGDFATVKAALAPLAEQVDYLDARTAVEIGLLLGKANVAFGEGEAATAAFTQVLTRRPRLALSPYAESPKVIEAWQKAGGHVEGE